jgi:hypothetical protein
MSAPRKEFFDDAIVGTDHRLLLVFSPLGRPEARRNQ